MKPKARRFMHIVRFVDETNYVEWYEELKTVYLVKYNGERELTHAWSNRDVKRLINNGQWLEFKFIPKPKRKGKK